MTLHHPHGQIYAFPYIPPIPQAELEAGRAHRANEGRCLLCDIVAEERERAAGDLGERALFRLRAFFRPLSF